MKLFVVLAACLLGACDTQAVTRPPPETVDATITGTSDNAFSGARTWIIDAHGHRDCIIGIWGSKGDVIKVTCYNGWLH